MNRFPLKNSRKRGSYFFCYTLSFILLAFLVFSPFWLNGKSFIWKPDGLTQHYNSLVYYGNWGRSILKTLLTEHRLSVPLWDFSIGYGSDILTTLHYYVIGDPLNLLAWITPARYTEYLYAFLILLRMYLSGLTFSIFCFSMKRGKKATFAGALTYVFCGYALSMAPMHPYFINPMIYLPLLFLGVEKTLRGERGHILLGAAALSALSNFYFFYMLAILTVFYFFLRFFSMKHENMKRELFSALFRTALFSLVGTAIAAILLLPVLLQFFADARSDSSLGFAPLYGWDCLERFLDQFLSLTYTTGWTYLGFSGLALLSVALLFLKKKELLSLKIAFTLATILLLLPAAGSLMNGFSYPANRWSFGYAFLVALILSYTWPKFFTLSGSEWSGLVLILSAYLSILLFSSQVGSKGAFFSLGLALLSLTLLLRAPLGADARPLFPERFREPFLFCLLALSLVGNSLNYYREDPDGLLGRFVDAGEGFSTLERTTSGMMSVFLPEDGSLGRTAQEPVPLRNDNLNYHLRTIQYYWSLSNGAITQYFNEMALPFRERAFKYSDLNNRAQLHALAGVNRYVRHDPNEYLPYPFADLEVYEYLGDVYFTDSTDLFLPFSYTSDVFISRQTYENLPYLRRQQALMQGVLCDSIPEGFPEASLSFQEKELPFELSHHSDLVELEGRYYALKDGATLTLSFEGLENCETYLLIEGMEASSLKDLDLYQKDPLAGFFQEEWEGLSTYQKRQIKRNSFYSSYISRFPISCKSQVLDSEFSYYAAMTESSFDRSDFLVNMGYSEQGQTSITITLPYKGAYSFRNLSVLCLPLANLKTQTERLSLDRLEQISIETNFCRGNISLEDRKLLCLQIPYSPGWRAQVDGVDVPLIRANTMNMALPLEEGDHEIELYYRTPGLRIGFFLSFLGLSFWLTYFLKTSKRRRK